VGEYFSLSASSIFLGGRECFLQPRKIILADREKHSLPPRKIILADRGKHSLPRRKIILADGKNTISHLENNTG
jgi:hypothetical protein